VTDVWCQCFTQFIRIVGGKVDLVSRTVEAKADCFGCGAAVEIIDE
jgi:hypothetical protein